MRKLNFSDSEIKKIIKKLNKRGFILEDRAYTTLIRKFSRANIKKNFVVSGSENRKTYTSNDTAEIDIYIEGMNIFIIECKKTDTTWFFSKNKEYHNTLFLMRDNGPYGIGTISGQTKHIMSAHDQMPLKFSKGGKLDTSYTGRKDIRDHVNQVIRATKIYLSQIKQERRFENKFLIPMIITNANLYLFEYNDSDINNKCNLNEDIKPIEVPYLAYNIPAIMGWGISGEKDISIVGLKNIHEVDDLKSILIVNINEVDRFITKIEEVITLFSSRI